MAESCSISIVRTLIKEMETCRDTQPISLLRPCTVFISLPLPTFSSVFLFLVTLCLKLEKQEDPMQCGSWLLPRKQNMVVLIWQHHCGFIGVLKKTVMRQRCSYVIQGTSWAATRAEKWPIRTYLNHFFLSLFFPSSIISWAWISYKILFPL